MPSERPRTASPRGSHTGSCGSPKVSSPDRSVSDPALLRPAPSLIPSARPASFNAWTSRTQAEPLLKGRGRPASRCACERRDKHGDPECPRACETEAQPASARALVSQTRGGMRSGRSGCRRPPSACSGKLDGRGSRSRSRRFGVVDKPIGHRTTGSAACRGRRPACSRKLRPRASRNSSQVVCPRRTTGLDSRSSGGAGELAETQVAADGARRSGKSDAAESPPTGGRVGRRRGARRARFGPSSWLGPQVPDEAQYRQAVRLPHLQRDASRQPSPPVRATPTSGRSRLP